MFWNMEQKYDVAIHQNICSLFGKQGMYLYGSNHYDNV